MYLLLYQLSSPASSVCSACYCRPCYRMLRDFVLQVCYVTYFTEVFCGWICHAGRVGRHTLEGRPCPGVP